MYFCPRTSLEWAGREKELPFDQLELLALIVPRHFYVASAGEDNWADQRGEYLAAYHASPVYALYGMQGILSPEMPPLDSPVMTDAGYHIRTGKHNQLPYD